VTERKPPTPDIEGLARDMQATMERLRDLQGEVQDLQGVYFGAFIQVLAGTIRASGWEPRTVVRALREALDPKRPRSGGWGSGAWRRRATPDCVYSGRGQLPACILDDMRAKGLDPRQREDRDRYRDQFMEPVPSPPAQ
jgi:hypothetical protein